MDGLRFAFEILGDDTVGANGQQGEPAEVARQAAAVAAQEAVGRGKAGSGTGAYVQGLFLECARWDGERRVLADCAPKQVTKMCAVFNVLAHVIGTNLRARACSLARCRTSFACRSSCSAPPRRAAWAPKRTTVPYSASRAATVNC